MTTLTVNGEEHPVPAAPDTPLLYVLRNDLGLTGTKFGCGLGVCGACTVLVDGEPVHACETPVSAVAGREVTTVEGLGAGPLPRAFLDEQAGQCGYCLAGILVRAAALLASNPSPTTDEVRTALDGNLCRCGAHNRIVRAVLRAAAS
jgi:nicotinate dehydrogenase subunit A